MRRTLWTFVLILAVTVPLEAQGDKGKTTVPECSDVETVESSKTYEDNCWDSSKLCVVDKNAGPQCESCKGIKTFKKVDNKGTCVVPECSDVETVESSKTYEDNCWDSSKLCVVDKDAGPQCESCEGIKTFKKVDNKGTCVVPECSDVETVESSKTYEDNCWDSSKLCVVDKDAGPQCESCKGIKTFKKVDNKGTCVVPECSDVETLESSKTYEDNCWDSSKLCVVDKNAGPQCESCKGIKTFKKVDNKGTCVVPKCSDVETVESSKTYEDNCWDSSKLCVVDKDAGPQCESCKGVQTFKKVDNKGTCVVPKCSDVETVDSSKTYEDNCWDSSKLCVVDNVAGPQCESCKGVQTFKKVDNKGTCVVPKCSDVETVESSKTYEDNCWDTSKLCVVDNVAGPQCESCKGVQTFKKVDNKGTCVVPKCSDVQTGATSKTYEDNCWDSSKLCVVDNVVGPQCESCKGVQTFKKVDNKGTCVVPKCSDVETVATSKTYDDNCWDINKICVVDNAAGPQCQTCEGAWKFEKVKNKGTCVVKTCEDSNEENKQWSIICLGKNKVCENGVEGPKCGACIKNFKKDDDASKDTCIAKTCKDQTDDGKYTWNKYCELLGGDCSNQKDKAPKCVCKFGFIENPPANFCRLATCADSDFDCKGLDGMKCENEPGQIPQCVCAEDKKIDNGLGQCIFRTCKDNVKGSELTWEQDCNKQGEGCMDFNGPVCIETDKMCKPNSCSKEHTQCIQGTNGFHCECKVGFQSNTESNCTVAQNCSNEHVLEKKSWDDFCKSIHRTCTEVKDNSPKCDCEEKYKEINNICIPHICTDKPKGKTTTYEEECKNQTHKECGIDDKGFPKCICKTGSKENGEKCEAQACTDNHPINTTISWDKVCEAEDNKKCDIGDDELPKCVCKTGFKEDGKSCKAQTCEDVHQDSKRKWKDHCLNDTKKCFPVTDKSPICVVKSCDDIKEGQIKWNDYCEGKNKTCVLKSNEEPECLCRNGFNSLKNPETCEPDTCDDISSLGKLPWKELCENQNKTCVPNQIEGPPLCKCKKGFVQNNAGECEALLCSKLNFTDGLNATCTKGLNISSVCTFMCNHGFELNKTNPVSFTCLDDGNWDKKDQEEPTCQAITDVCADLNKVPNGKVIHCGKAGKGQICKFSCNPGYQLVVGSDSSLNQDDLTCKEGKVWDKIVKCTEKCEIDRYKQQCLLYGATCKSPDDDENQCECGSPYLRWKKGSGCIFWENAFKTTFFGITYKSPSYYSDVPDEIVAIQKFLFEAVKETQPDLGNLIISQCDRDRAICAAELFFTTKKNTATRKTELKNICQTGCTDKNIVIDKKEIQKVEPVPIENPCESGLHNCLSLEACSKTSGYKFTCGCPKNYEVIPRSPNPDPNVQNSPICVDVDECKDKTTNDCDLEKSDCVNQPGSYRCSCLPTFVPEKAGSRVCVGFCDLNKEYCVHGTCTPGNGTVYCLCPEKWTGAYCQIEIVPKTQEDKDNGGDKDKVPKNDDSDKLKKAQSDVAIVGAVLGVLLAIVIVVCIVSIFKLRKARSQSTSDRGRHVEMRKRAD